MIQLSASTAMSQLYSRFSGAGFMFSTLCKRFDFNDSKAGPMAWINVYDSVHDEMLRGVVPLSLLPVINAIPVMPGLTPTESELIEQVETISHAIHCNVSPENMVGLHELLIAAGAQLISHDEAASAAVAMNKPVMAFFIILSNPDSPEQVRTRQVFAAGMPGASRNLSDAEALGMLHGILETDSVM